VSRYNGPSMAPGEHHRRERPPGFIGWQVVGPLRLSHSARRTA
jgi:hypothetical protein